MSTWAFTARDPAGRVVRGSEFAVDELDLDRRLEERELLLVSARRDQKVRRRRGGSRSLIDFCHHLGTSVEAGVPLLEGLRDLQDGGSSPLAPQLEDLARRVESGQTLSAAMGAHPSLFPEYLLALVGAGEESGKLDVILHELTAHLEWREDLRR